MSVGPCFISLILELIEVKLHINLILGWRSVNFSKVLATSRCGGGVKMFAIKYRAYIVLHLPRCKIPSHNTADAYNKGYAIKLREIVIQHPTSPTARKTSVLAGWLTSQLGRLHDPS